MKSWADMAVASRVGSSQARTTRSTIEANLRRDPGDGLGVGTTEVLCCTIQVVPRPKTGK